jgi:alkylation response protein AidB-like acyl-CoA dehydrogenase
MDFSFSADQLMFVESVRDYLKGTHGPEVLRRLDAEGNRDPAIWQGLVEMGLAGLCVPEAHGGLGMGLIEAALIAAECGRACLAEPLVDIAFVAVPWLVARDETEKLSAITRSLCRMYSILGLQMAKVRLKPASILCAIWCYFRQVAAMTIAC